MTKKDFEMNASVHFVYDGWEFEASQSKADPDGTWYLYHYSIQQGDEKLAVVSNPFSDYDSFLMDAEIVAKNWIRKHNK